MDPVLPMLENQTSVKTEKFIFQVAQKIHFFAKITDLFRTYSNHLNTGLVWYSNGRFVSSCQMVQYLNDDLKKD